MIFFGIFRNTIYTTTKRSISKTSSMLGGYEGEGKTHMHILNTEADIGLMIDGYSQVGFRLNNTMTILGSMIIFPRTVLSWDITDLEQVNEESLTLFSVIEPKIDILVLGIGDRPKNYNFFKKLMPFSRKYQIPFEILPTDQACSTFNFLNSEGRNVAGAMIPPKTIRTAEEDIMRTKLNYHNLFRARDV